MLSDFLTRVQSERVMLAGDLSLIYSAPDGLSRPEKDRWLQIFQWWEVERQQIFFSCMCFSFLNFFFLETIFVAAGAVDDSESSFSPLPL